MIRVNIDLTEVQKRLMTLRHRLINTRPLMREIGDIMLDSTLQNFQAGGRPKWVPSRAAEARQGQTLIRKGFNGGLLGSIHKAYGDNYAQVGTNKVYAAIHQVGGDIKRRQVAATSDFRPFDGRPTKLRKYSVGRLQARPFFNLQPQDLANINTTVIKHLGDKK